MKKKRDMSARGMRPADARSARRWAAERARMHEHNRIARRESPADAVVLVLPSRYSGYSEFRGQLMFPASMRDAAIKAGTLINDPYAHLYGTEERT